MALFSLLAFLIGVLFPVALPAFDQTAGATTGAVTGQAIDATGAAVAGVTVVIASDVLMGTHTAVTSGEGLYRFPVLPPGDYTLVFRLDGFKTVNREGVRVSIGFTATIDVELEIATLTENVVVERRSPVVDRQSTAVAAIFTPQMLADLPGARSMGALLAATPAVQMTRFDVGGNLEATGQYGAYGTPGFNRPTVEGINVTGILGTGFALNFGSFEEVSVGTAAHTAEWPTIGVQMQFIAKSGGNRYRGTVYADYEHTNWQSFNIDADQIARGAAGGGGLTPGETNRMWRYRDLNADLGGYVTKDRLWWYSSVRDQDVSARVVNFPVRPLRTHVSSYSGKATLRLTGRDKIIGFVQTGRNHQANRLSPFGPTGSPLNAASAIHESADATAEQRARGWLWKGEWNAAMNDRTYVEVRAGQFGANRPETPNGAGPRYEDIADLTVRGGARDWQEDLRREQLSGSMSYFRDDWFGTHLVKAGGDMLRNTATEIWRSGFQGDVLHVLQNTHPLQVYVFETPSRSESGLWTLASYVNDSWQVNEHLTVNLGLRFERHRVFLPEQHHPVGRFNSTPQDFAAVANVIDWNLIAPRIGATHDFSGDGKTVAKFSYGQYWLAPGTQLGFNANPNANQWWRQYRWEDANNSGAWEEGEQGPVPLNSRGGTALESLDPELRLPFVREVAAWIERELLPNLGVRTGVVWRSQQQNYLRQNVNQPFNAFSTPVAIADPGIDGAIGTPDDGPAVNAFELGAQFAELTPVNIVRNVPQASGRWWTWEIVANRRFSSRWSLVAGFAHTWNADQTGGYLGQPVRNNTHPLTPNDLIHARDDGQYRFRTWSAKVHGTYAGPWDLRITPYLRHQSGQPFGRTFTASLNYGTVRILAEPIGTRRMDNVTIVDVRIEKGVRLPGARRLAGFIDLFNLFNTNAEQSLIWSSGASFLRPLSIVSPRIMRAGAKLEW